MAPISPTIRYLPPADISPISMSSFNIDNLRTPLPTDPDIIELCQSILTSGVRVPLIAFIDPTTSKITLKDGHRRLTAALLAVSLGSDTLKIPVVIERTPVTALDLILDQVRTNSSSPPTPLQLANRCALAMKHGASVATLATTFGKSQTYIYNLIDLLNSPQEILNSVESNTISASTAIELVQSSSTPEEAVQTLRRATKTSPTARITKKHLNPPSSSSSSSSPPSVSLATLRAGIEAALKLYPSAQEMRATLLATLGRKTQS